MKDIEYPGFRRLNVVVTAADADRLAAWCARTELPAELRGLIGNLGVLVGWDQQMILLGSMLVNTLAILEASDQPKENP